MTTGIETERFGITYPEWLVLSLLKREHEKNPKTSKELNDIVEKAVEIGAPKVLSYALSQGGVGTQKVLEHAFGYVGWSDKSFKKRVKECALILIEAGTVAKPGVFAEYVGRLDMDVITAYLDRQPAAANDRYTYSDITTLTNAVEAGKTRVVELLINRGADIFFHRSRPLEIARRAPFSDIVALLEEAEKTQLAAQQQPAPATPAVAQQPPIAPDFNKGLDKAVTSAPIPKMKKTAFPGAAGHVAAGVEP